MTVAMCGIYVLRVKPDINFQVVLRGHECVVRTPPYEPPERIRGFLHEGTKPQVIKRCISQKSELFIHALLSGETARRTSVRSRTRRALLHESCGLECHRRSRRSLAD